MPRFTEGSLCSRKYWDSDPLRFVTTDALSCILVAILYQLVQMNLLFLVAVGLLSTFVLTDPQMPVMVSRGGITVHPSPEITGEYKSKLNHLKQTGVIREFKWVDRHKRDASGKSGFRSVLEVNFVDGRSLRATSQFYSTKQAAQEVAAKCAINAVSKKVTTCSQQLVYKRDLNNLMIGTYGVEPPTYKTSQVRGEQLFECTVSHPLIKRVSGGVDSITRTGNSIREAENSAAWTALGLLCKK